MKKVERAEDHEAPEQISEVVEEEEDGMLPGFRFHPTDEELVGFYLRRKVEKKRLSIEIIKEMDIYKHEPWDLPNQMMTTAGEKEWYFFCRRGRKYRNSVRPNRVTGCGFWKATGIDRPIHSSGHCIGLKKSLVYYRGHAGKGTKTDWMMHEFRLPVGCKSDAGNTAAAASKNAASMQLEAEVWTICRIFQRSASYKKQPNSYKTSTPTKSPPESSSVTNCVDPDEYMCCSSSGGGGDGSPVADLLQVEDYYQENIQSGHKQLDVAAGEWRSTMNGGGGGQYSDQSPPLCSSLHEQKPSWNDFERDIIWDWEELGRIEEFLADENFSLDSNRGYSYNKLGMDHAVS